MVQLDLRIKNRRLLYVCTNQRIQFYRQQKKERNKVMNIFISGGCKNGKSMYAQTLAKNMAKQNDSPLYYVATMLPCDDEDIKRIERHLREREGWGFETVEQGININECFEPSRGVDAKGAFLLDSVTALLSNEMFRPGGVFDADAAERVADELIQFARTTGNTVFVSDYIYGDAGKYDEWTEKYREGLAYIDRKLAKECDRVIEVLGGNTIDYK